MNKFKFIFISLGILAVTFGCTKTPTGPNAQCQSAIDYYKTAGVNLVEDKTDQSKVPEKVRLAYKGSIPISGPGILSSKPTSISFMCSNSGSITIFGIDIKADKNKASEAIKTLSPVFLMDAPLLKVSESQKKFFAEMASKLQPDGDWKTKVENGYVLRVMTTQADESGNYFLTIHAGNAESYKE